LQKKRLDVARYDFYSDNQKVDYKKKKKEPYIPASFEELDKMIRQKALFEKKNQINSIFNL